MDPGNSRTVFVVQVDNTKDLSDARRYGTLKAIYGKPRKPYDTASMVARARRVLAEWRPGDYLLMIGDPALCAASMVVAAEKEDKINLLSWDRDSFSYAPQHWDFGSQLEEDDYATADD